MNFCSMFRLLTAEKLSQVFGWNELICFSEPRQKWERAFRVAKQWDLEGIMAKRKHSLYFPERERDWLKIKNYKDDLWVVGYFPSPGGK